MTRSRLTWLRLTVLAVLVVALSSCGGGGEEREISVSIQNPTENSTYTTNTEELTVGGSASFETVSVSWSNAAGGGGEATISAGRSWTCGFPPYFPATCKTPATWIASIPLVVGTNDVTVLASDADGNSGRDTITITRLPNTTSSTVPAEVPDTKKWPRFFSRYWRQVSTVTSLTKIASYLKNAYYIQARRPFRN